MAPISFVHIALHINLTHGRLKTEHNQMHIIYHLLNSFLFFCFVFHAFPHDQTVFDKKETRWSQDLSYSKQQLIIDLSCDVPSSMSICVLFSIHPGGIFPFPC